MKPLITALVLLVVSSGPSPAQPPGGSPAAAAIRAFVETCNGADAATIRAFIAEKMDVSRGSPEELAARLVEDAKRTGGLDIAGIRRESSTRVRLAATARKGGESWTFVFELPADQPGRLVLVGVDDGDTAAESPVPPPRGRARMTMAEIAEALDRHVTALSAADAFSGVVLLAEEGTPVFRKAWGEANKAFGAPNRPDTKFNLGSINKIFTQAAVAQLVEQGRLSLDDTIAKHLPDYPGPGADRITVRHLLEHASGLGDIFTDEFRRESKTGFRTPKDFFPLFTKSPLQFEPGRGQAYSNAGYMVRGAIVEAASGQDYASYVHERVFTPAGMTNTGVIEADLPVPNVAEGYTRGMGNARTKEWRRNVFMNLYRGSPAGGGYSTVDDLLAFAQALREGRLFGPSVAAIVGGGRRDMGIGGGGPGTNAMLEMNGPHTIVVLANYDPPSAELVARAARRLVGDAAR